VDAEELSNRELAGFVAAQEGDAARRRVDTRLAGQSRQRLAAAMNGGLDGPAIPVFPHLHICASIGRSSHICDFVMQI